MRLTILAHIDTFFGPAGTPLTLNIDTAATLVAIIGIYEQTGIRYTYKVSAL